MSPSNSVPYEEVIYARILGYNQDDARGKLGPLDVQTAEAQLKDIPDVEFMKPIVRGRVWYSDELGLARWSQRFKVVEYAVYRRPRTAQAADEGQVIYKYEVERWTPAKREPDAEDDD